MARHVRRSTSSSRQSGSALEPTTKGIRSRTEEFLARRAFERRARCGVAVVMLGGPASPQTGSASPSP